MNKTGFAAILLSIFLPAIIIGHTSDNGQRLFVWAKQGLSLRSEPSPKAPKIKTLPYGTPLIFIEQVHYDSVLVIPSVTGKHGARNPAFYLPGYWTRVCAGADTGFVFSGYLSAMTPFDPNKPVIGDDPGPSISAWLAQTAGVLDKRLLSETDLTYTLVYKNHVIEHYHSSEGSGRSQYIFPEGMSFENGFLLCNYFADLHFTQQEIAECESFELIINEVSFDLYTVGGRGGIVWFIRLSWHDGILIIEEGGGC